MEDRALTQVIRPLRGGQVCLPGEFRRQLGIDEGTPLLLTLNEDKIEITPVDSESIAEKGWTRELHAMMKLVRQETQGMDEAEIETLIREALDKARSEDCD